MSIVLFTRSSNNLDFFFSFKILITTITNQLQLQLAKKIRFSNKFFKSYFGT